MEQTDELKRKRVLLIWYEISDRPELLEPFVNLSDQFEFIHLNFNTPKERKKITSPFKMIYWFNYPTPKILLKRIKPDIIFSEFPSDLKTIALNVVAKKAGIPYISMTHGIYFEDSFDIHIANENSFRQWWRYHAYYKILFFYLTSIRLSHLKYVPHLIKFLFYFIRFGYFDALDKVKFKLRWPDKYIVYQLKNSVEIMKGKHNFPPERLIPIGVPQFDSLFHYWNESISRVEPGNYYLMIDTAWIYNNEMPSPETINNTYLKLSAYCKSRNCRLFVKLHPHWYGKKDLPKDDNISYFRNIPQQDLSALIIRARGCFLYFSTLSIPIVPYKNCYFLYFKNVTGDLKEITSLGVAKSLNVEQFEIGDIDFENGFDRSQIAKYIDQYLFSTDGKATKRLAAVLLDSLRQKAPDPVS
jgi:hypothetical protein